MRPQLTKKGTTLSRTVKDYAPDRIELEIGDSKQAEFYPQAKISRWDNETNFSIRRDNGARSYKEVDGKIVAESAKEDVVIYELDGFEDGGLEIELHLKEKPDTNVFDFTLQTKGLNFFYQPPLTPEEIAEGVHQPENVIGSYAVYHKTKRDNRIGGKEYKTGKAFHIYRPHVTDAKGQETWGELNINEGLLTVTVPQTFLDTAVYPVIIDPTFGYTGAGGAGYWIARRRESSEILQARRDGSTYTIPEDGTLDSLTAYMYVNTSPPEALDVTLYVNEEDSGGAGTHGEIAAIERSNMSVTNLVDSPTSYTFTASSEALTSGTDYVLSALGNPNDISLAGSTIIGVYVTRDNTGSDNFHSSTASGSTAYSTLKTSPWVPSFSTTGIKEGIYATYTVEANEERTAETHGSDTANAERDAQLTGAAVPTLTATQDGAAIALSWTYE